MDRKEIIYTDNIVFFARISHLLLENSHDYLCKLDKAVILSREIRKYGIATTTEQREQDNMLVLKIFNIFPR
jgi:hypothetical protein